MNNVSVYNKRPSLIIGPPVGKRQMRVNIIPGLNKIPEDYWLGNDANPGASNHKMIAMLLAVGTLEVMSEHEGAQPKEKVSPNEGKVDLPESLEGLNESSIAYFLKHAKEDDKDLLIQWADEASENGDDDTVELIVERCKELKLIPDLD